MAGSSPAPHTIIPQLQAFAAFLCNASLGCSGWELLAQGSNASPLSCSCVAQQGGDILVACLTPVRGSEVPANMGTTLVGTQHLCSWRSLSLQL